MVIVTTMAPKSVIMVLTCIITSITACPIRVTGILVIRSVSIFRSAVILYIQTYANSW